ncbi:hypothetical protein Tsubulata_000118 [Turnera subulata]|uniref:Transcription elongation factor n=1 Tax=Turnera subulata TaxID=218843 RepID=A0A9Q0FJE6_9ROSI|nr:hypothetical protein Tsubulata_000118 [Turnera subulata]
MIEKELVELFEAAKKAADAAVSGDLSPKGPEVTRCVDALKQLKDFPITSDMLVSTQVGKQLRPLTKHPKLKIKSAASDVLDIWKKIVIDEATRKRNEAFAKSDSFKGVVSRSESVKVEKPQMVSAATVSTSQNVQKIEKMVQGGTVKVEKVVKEKETTYIKNPSNFANAPPKLTTLVKCNDALRDKIRELLVEALSKVANEADAKIIDQVNERDPIRLAVAVESVMFEKLGKSNGAQKSKYRSIMFNLKDANNPDLRRKVLLGEVTPEKLVTLTPEEMASEERKRENKQIKEKALFDCELGAGPKATTDQFKCGRCGQRKTTYHQMQTRSADEPMTTYVTCVNCNNHWKFC